MKRIFTALLVAAAAILLSAAAPIVPVNVLAFGAKCDGVTNDSAAIQKAIDAASSIQIPDGTCIAAGLTITSNKTLFGTSRTKSRLKNTANSAIITITGIENEIRSLGFEGSGKGATYDAGLALNRGILVSGANTAGYHNVFLDLYFYNFGRSGLAFTNTNAGNHPGNQVDSSLFFSNNIGLELTTLGEYVTSAGSHYQSNHYGQWVGAGNFSAVGGSMTGNKTAVYIAAGPNNAHGVHSGVLINHNTEYGIRAESITNGYTFNGCHLFEGSIYLVGSTGVVFRNGILDASAYYFEGSTGTVFENNKLPAGYGNVINNDYNGTPSWTLWRGNRAQDGVSIITEWEGMASYATPANTTYTPAQLTAEQILAWTGAFSRTYQPFGTGYHNITKYSAFAANVWTSRGLSGRPATVRVALRIQKNAADNANDLYVYVARNGTIIRYLDRTVLSTTIVQFTLYGTMNLATGDTLDFRVGASPAYANNVTMLTTATYIELEGL